MCLCIWMCAVCIVHVQDTYTNVYVQDTYTNVYRTHMHMHAYMHAYIHTLVGSGPLFPQSVLQCLCSCAAFRRILCSIAIVCVYSISCCSISCARVRCACALSPARFSTALEVRYAARAAEARRACGKDTGTVRILKDLSGTIEGRDVLIVEDIIDTTSEIISSVTIFLLSLIDNFHIEFSLSNSVRIFFS